jgi:hypothetical protein
MSHEIHDFHAILGRVFVLFFILMYTNSEACVITGVVWSIDRDKEVGS